MEKLNQEQKVAILPAGSHVRIMGCRIVTLQDVQVGCTQESLDSVLKAQADFDSGISVVGEMPTSHSTTENLSIAGLHSLDGNDDSGKAIL